MQTALNEAMHRGTQAEIDRPSPTPSSVAIGFLGLVVAVLALRLLTAVAVRGTGSASGAARPDDVLLVLLAWVGVALSAWLALGSLLGIASLLPGASGRLAAQVGERVTPLAVRKVLTLVLGASVGSVALPSAAVSSADSVPLPRSATGAPWTVRAATASDPGPGFAPGPVSDTTVALTPGYVPTSGAAAGIDPAPGRAPGRAADSPGYVPSAPPPVLPAERSRLLVPSPRAAAATQDVVTVHRGDSLWAVAARHLGAGGSDAQIAREWPRWYAANRDVVGDDPDLLVAGQQLRPPSSVTTSTRSHDETTVPAERGASE